MVIHRHGPMQHLEESREYPLRHRPVQYRTIVVPRIGECEVIGAWVSREKRRDLVTCPHVRANCCPLSPSRAYACSFPPPVALTFGASALVTFTLSTKSFSLW